MIGGAYFMHRGWMENPVFKPEPYTEREAWLWLIESAAFKPTRVRVGVVCIDLARGQLAASLRFMAKKWRWNEPRVRRFISRLENDAMIDAAGDAGVTVISIRNYDIYQAPRRSGKASSDAVDDAPPTQERRSTDAKENKGNKGNNSSGEGRATRLPPEFSVPDEWKTKAAEARSAANLPPVDTNTEATKFVNHFLSAGGEKGRKINWERTYINWVLNARAPFVSAAERTLAAAAEAGLLPKRPDPDAKFRQWLKGYKPGGYWPQEILQTPRPEDPNTGVPLPLLVEFGFRSAA